jgi:5-methylcytosine-specific restriction endonuclease McrA
MANIASKSAEIKSVNVLEYTATVYKWTCLKCDYSNLDLADDPNYCFCKNCGEVFKITLK